jgi:hypothetical protein
MCACADRGNCGKLDVSRRSFLAPLAKRTSDGRYESREKYRREDARL